MGDRCRTRPPGKLGGNLTVRIKEDKRRRSEHVVLLEVARDVRRVDVHHYNVHFAIILFLEGTHGALALERLADCSPIGMEPDEDRPPSDSLFGGLQTGNVVLTQGVIY
jgi:hypothetical protein